MRKLCKGNPINSPKSGHYCFEVIKEGCGVAGCFRIAAMKILRENQLDSPVVTWSHGMSLSAKGLYRRGGMIDGHQYAMTGSVFSIWWALVMNGTRDLSCAGGFGAGISMTKGLLMLMLMLILMLMI